jgi:predicted transcriptional regulator
MSIVITLSPELEQQLQAKATRQGQDINLVATELLTSVLESEEEDSAEAIEGIQQGLDEFAAGKFRSFDEYAAEQRQKYNLLKPIHTCKSSLFHADVDSIPSETMRMT